MVDQQSKYKYSEAYLQLGIIKPKRFDDIQSPTFSSMSTANKIQ